MSDIQNKINKLGDKKSQNMQILEYLKTGYSLTALEALNKFQCMRLGARIFDLKECGYHFNTEIVHDSDTNKRYARYTLSTAKELI